MGRHKGSNNDAKEKLLAAAGRGFRLGGFGGAGVDGLAKEAGLTSGAFYAHFGSKAAAFRLAVVDGLEFLLNGVETFRQTHGKRWLKPFIDFYLGPRMQVELDEACAVPTFASDVARADDETREAYQVELDRIVTAMAEGLGGAEARARALRILAVLAGSAAMARAVKDETLRSEILAAAQTAAKAM